MIKLPFFSDTELPTRSRRGRLDATPEAMMLIFDFEKFANQLDWHHSAWLRREVVQAGIDKVHVAVRFARYRESMEFRAMGRHEVV